MEGEIVEAETVEVETSVGEISVEETSVGTSEVETSVDIMEVTTTVLVIISTEQITTMMETLGIIFRETQALSIHADIGIRESAKIHSAVRFSKLVTRSNDSVADQHFFPCESVHLSDELQWFLCVFDYKI